MSIASRPIAAVTLAIGALNFGSAVKRNKSRRRKVNSKFHWKTMIHPAATDPLSFSFSYSIPHFIRLLFIKLCKIFLTNFFTFRQRVKKKSNISITMSRHKLFKENMKASKFTLHHRRSCNTHLLVHLHRYLRGSNICVPRRPTHF